MKIYVASSWKNPYQPSVVEALRSKGHEVYDFRNPRPGDNGFHWSEISQNWKTWTAQEYRSALTHPLAEGGFKSDFDAMKWADVFVGVGPFGRSASLEMGWAAGAGKPTILYLPEMLGEAELMVKMCDHICTTIEEFLAALREVDAQGVNATPMNAITYILNQVMTRPELAYVLLATEALSRLAKAYAKQKGETPREVMNMIEDNAALTLKEEGIKRIVFKRIYKDGEDE